MGCTGVLEGSSPVHGDSNHFLTDEMSMMQEGGGREVKSRSVSCVDV